MCRLEFVSQEESEVRDYECNRLATLAATGFVCRQQVEGHTPAHLGLGVLRDPGSREGAQDACVADGHRKEQLIPSVRGDLVHDGGEDGYADGLLLLVFRRRPFAGGGKDHSKERYVHAFACKGGATPEEPRVVPDASNGGGHCRADVALDGLNMGLDSALNSGSFGYLLCVRGEDLARRRLQGASKSDVCESALNAPTDKVVSSRERNVDVVFSICSPVCGLDTSQSRCNSSSDGIQ